MAVQCDKDRKVAQEHHGTRNVQAVSAGEVAVVGRRVLERRLFCQHGG